MQRFYDHVMVLIFVVFLSYSCCSGIKSPHQVPEYDQVYDSLAHTQDQQHMGDNQRQDSINVNGISVGFDNMVYEGYLVLINNPDLQETGCDTWRLAVADAKNICRKMEKASGAEWGAYCYTYPCFYQGVVKNSEGRFIIKINAASHIMIQGNSGQEPQYFIRRKKSSYLMQPCNCCEN